jgi:hypothetical protein
VVWGHLGSRDKRLEWNSAYTSLISFQGEQRSINDLLAFTEAARDLGYTHLCANDHLVFSRPWLDGPTALAAVLTHSGHMTRTSAPSSSCSASASCRCSMPSAREPQLDDRSHKSRRIHRELRECAGMSLESAPRLDIARQ